jgi:drug/metabolite transporter (DMT)-like permease
VTRGYWPLLLGLAAMWGASYLFIKVGVEGGLPPGPLMFTRSLLAGVLLAGYLIATTGGGRALSALRGAWWSCTVLGALNAAIPFWLVAWGEKHIDSGVAAIAQATVPIFSILVGLRFLPHERIGPLRLAGVGIGLLGVGVLTGVDPGGGWWAVAGTLAVVLASVFYASAGIYGQLRIHEIPGPVLATGSMLASSVMLLPAGLAELPETDPSGWAIASLLALAIGGTAVAQLVLFRIIRLYGARKLSLVTYLMPGFALVYGALILDEPVSAAALAGLALILLGVALGSGALRSRRRATVLEAAAE